MAYRIEERDIVIDGFEAGIADNPYDGINELVNCNIISVPGEVSLSPVSIESTDGSFSGDIDSADTSTEVVSISGTSGAGRNGITAVVVTVTSGLTGITSGNTYWTTSNTGTSFVLYSDPDFSTPVNITADGTGSFVSVDMGKVNHFAQHNYQISADYCIDNNGRAWVTEQAVGYWKYAGNTLRSGETNGNGIFTITGADGADWLFLIGGSQFDYCPLDSTGDIGTWVYEYDPSTGAANADTAIMSGAITASTDHYSLNGQDDRVYICDDTFICAFYEKDGETFDPTTTTTYTFNDTALKIPDYDSATCLEELGPELLVGGQLDYIYPWDRKSATFRRRIWLAERHIQRMITVNTSTFIFAGKRGRIYRTEGSNVELYKKIPDHLAGGEDPLITFTDVARGRNQIYFGMTARNSTVITALDTYNGLWAIDVSTGALRQLQTLTGTNADAVAVLVSPVVDVPAAPKVGNGVYVAWEGDSSTYGIDGSNSVKWTSTFSEYQGYVVSDLIPVARLWDRRTFEQVELLLSEPLESIEQIKIEYRNKLGDSWTAVGDENVETTAGNFSAVFPVSFENCQWIQLKASLSGTTTGTGVRLRELRIR